MKQYPSPKSMSEAKGQLKIWLDENNQPLYVHPRAVAFDLMGLRRGDQKKKSRLNLKKIGIDLYAHALRDYGYKKVGSNLYKKTND